MALRREQLSPVDGFDNRIDWQAAVDRWNRGALRWVLGPGFLSCHLTTFALSFLALLTWNLIADPTDLHMIEPFRYWGVIVVFHIILLGGGMIGWKLLRMGETRAAPLHHPGLSVAAARGQQPPARRTGKTPGRAAPPRRPRQCDRPPLGQRAGPETAPPQPVPPPRDAETGWPEVPAMFRSAAVEADTTEGRRPISARRHGPDRLPSRLPSPAAVTPNPADEVVSVDHRGAGEARTTMRRAGSTASSNPARRTRTSAGHGSRQRPPPG